MAPEGLWVGGRHGWGALLAPGRGESLKVTVGGGGLCSCSLSKAPPCSAISPRIFIRDESHPSDTPSPAPWPGLRGSVLCGRGHTSAQQRRERGLLSGKLFHPKIPERSPCLCCYHPCSRRGTSRLQPLSGPRTSPSCIAALEGSRHP